LIPKPVEPEAEHFAAHHSRLRLLDAALKVFRARGYCATTVDEICTAAGLTKGSFFHHFKSKEELALAATQHWSAVTGGLFEGAPYQLIADPRERLLAYIDLRLQLLQGELPEVTCLLGTLVQEIFATHPAIRQACAAGIQSHADTVAHIVAQAKARYAPRADWSAEGLAQYTQAAIQGAFIMAKADGGVATAAQCIGHLKRYVELLLPVLPQASRRSSTPRTPVRISAIPTRPSKGSSTP
jgi:TetR/AcrR family transcriptional regulator, transcriptional repressor for nem operon